MDCTKGYGSSGESIVQRIDSLFHRRGTFLDGFDLYGHSIGMFLSMSKDFGYSVMHCSKFPPHPRPSPSQSPSSGRLGGSQSRHRRHCH